MSDQQNWVEACKVQDLVKNSGVCSLIGSHQIALYDVRVGDTQIVYAIENYDPIGQAAVLYRGIIGSVGEQFIVASPLYKQRFCLATGQCLDDQAHAVRAYQTRIDNDRVLVQLTSEVA